MAAVSWHVGLPVLLMLQIVIRSSKADAGVILVPPSTQTVPLGSTASFFCSGKGHISRWSINGNIVFDYDMFTSETRGFNFTETDDRPAQIHNISMTVVAFQENNNTKIECLTYIDNQPTFSRPPAYLFIVGSPLPVQATLQVANATTLAFQWEPPFSYMYENYPILRYNVKLLNISSGNMIRNETIDSVTHSMIQSIAEPEKVCAELQFTITAENAIGESNSTVITGGFPIAPGPFQSEIETYLVFLQDGTPEVDIQFKPPRVCTYQWATYTIIITDVRGEIIIRVGPNIYFNDDVIKKEITSPALELDKEYSAEVIVETRAGNTNAYAIFDTNFRPFSPIVPTTGGVQNEKDVSLVIVIAGSVGGACLLALLGITALLVCICGQRKRMRSRRLFGSTSSRPPMVTNPIYEGVVYESIDEGKFTSVVNANSPTASEEFPQFPSNRSSQDYENTKKASEDIGVSLSTPVAPNEDNYTMMNSAGPDNERSNLQSNDNLRYVPEPVTLV